MLVPFLSSRHVEAAVAPSRAVEAVRGAEDLEAANDALHALGVHTELDLERDALAS